MTVLAADGSLTPEAQDRLAKLFGAESRFAYKGCCPRPVWSPVGGITIMQSAAIPSTGQLVPEPSGYPLVTLFCQRCGRVSSYLLTTLFPEMSSGDTDLPSP